MYLLKGSRHHIQRQRPASAVLPALMTFGLAALTGVKAAEPPSDDHAPATKSKAMTLAPIVVSGERMENPTLTEGLESYTSPAMSTATGLPLAPRETPQSVTVVTRQRIEDQNLNSVIDVINNTVGLHSQEFDDGRYTITSRGIQVDNILYDGVPVDYDRRFDYGDNHIDSAILDHVEVLRGANGLMNGTGNPSAAINLVRKKPTQAFQASLKGEIGSWKHGRAVVDVAGPLLASGDVRGRIVGAHQQRESYRDRFEEMQSTLYGVIEADLSERTLLTIGADVQNTQPEGAMAGGLPLFHSDGSRTDYDRSTSTAPQWSGADKRAVTAFASLEHQLNTDWRAEATFTFIDNHLDNDVFFPSKYPDPDTNTGMKPTSVTLIDGRRTQRSVDVKLDGQYTLFGRDHELGLGLHNREKDFRNPYYRADLSTLPRLGDFRDNDFSYAKPDWPSQSSLNSKGTTQQRSAYAVTRLNITDPLTVIGGARITDWETDQVSFGSDNDFSVDKELTPYAGVIYDFTPHWSGYTSYTRIFDPQAKQDESGDYLEPVRGESYEAGLKAAYFDGRVNASLTYFDIRQDGVGQQVQGKTLPGGVSVYESIDGTRTHGLETQIQGEMTTNWRLFLGYTDFSAEGPDGKAINTDTPRRQLKLFTTYDLAGNWHRLTVGGGVRWQGPVSQTATGPDGKREVGQGSYGVVELMARYRVTPSLTLSANANNVLDETYYTQIGAFNQYQYGAPRNVTASLRYEF